MHDAISKCSTDSLHHTRIIVISLDAFQVLVVLVEKGGLFAQHKVVYFVIGTRVSRFQAWHTQSHNA